jgi:hypothetical protein
MLSEYKSPGKFQFLQVNMLAVVLITNLLGWAGGVEAAYGLPESTRFAYGANIDPMGEQVELALNTAVGLGMDWVNFRFDWNAMWPERSQAMDLSSWRALMSFAQGHNLHVMISITNPPPWALTSSGPDPAITAGLVAQLARLFPEPLLAIELFPAANTQSGWAAPPDARAYVALLTASQEALSAISSPVKLVAAGLTSLNGSSSRAEDDLNDLAYLQQLYDNGAADYMPILSMRMPDLTDAPLADPADAPRLMLRHYEKVREVMLDNNHAYGIIWITGFSLADQSTVRGDELTTGDSQSKTAMESSDQVHWIFDAYHLMQSQLYIGAAFIDCLNSSKDGQPGTSHCLILNKNGSPSLHPILSAIAQVITADRSGHALYVQTVLEKKSHLTILKSLTKIEQP